MRHAILLLILLGGCASNIKDTDLLNSNLLMLPPSGADTVFVQSRNTSDNTAVALNDLTARLTAKGYRIVQDPNTAQYVVLTNIVYCNLTKPELPVETMVASGYGSSIGSTLMSGLSGLANMAGSLAGSVIPGAGMVGMVASSAVPAAMGAVGSVGSAVGGMFTGPSGPKPNDDVVYACVADMQVTDRTKMATGNGGTAGIYQSRLAASVYQRKLDEEEATPLLQQRLSAAVAGHF